MSDEWRTNSFCVSSTDSGRFTEIEEFQELNDETNSTYQQYGTFQNRFVAYHNQKSNKDSAAVGVFLRNLKPVPIDPSIDPIFSTCFNCWQFGHRYWKCPLPRRHKFCINCGRMNLFIHSCPRCGRAYHMYMAINRHTNASNFNYYPEYNYYDKEVVIEQVEDEKFQSEEVQSQELVGHITELDTNGDYSDSYKMGYSKTSTTYYYSPDEDEDYNGDAVVDEEKKSNEPASRLLRDFLKLLEDVKHWPIEVQNKILLHFAIECRNHSQYK